MSTTTFVWKGTTPQGEPMAGEYEAAAKPEVAAYLRKRKIAVRSIRPKPRDIKFNFGPKKGVKVKDMSVFTRQFKRHMGLLPLTYRTRYGRRPK